MTVTINSAGQPTPIKTGACPNCGMGIQRAGTADAYCPWCGWPDAETARRRTWEIVTTKPRFQDAGGAKEGTMTTDIEALVAEGQAVEERLYKRLGTKSARALDVDACVVIAKITDALERQQAVLKLLRSLRRRALLPTELLEALVALDAPTEGAGKLHPWKQGSGGPGCAKCGNLMSDSIHAPPEGGG